MNTDTNTDDISFLGLNLKAYIRLVFFCLCFAGLIFVATPALSSFSFTMAYVVLCTGLTGILSETVFKTYRVWHEVFAKGNIAAGIAVAGFFYLLSAIIERA